MRTLGCLTALVLFAWCSAAGAAVISVGFSGTTNSLAGGPYTVSGSFVWDPSVTGASSDPSDVPIFDPGIGNFMVELTGGTNPTTFTDINIASGQFGPMDLSVLGAGLSIFDGSVCIQGAGGVGGCANDNPAGVIIMQNSLFAYSPGGVSASASFGPLLANVNEVPLPAGVALLLTGLAGVLVVGRRRGRPGAGPAHAAI